MWPPGPSLSSFSDTFPVISSPLILITDIIYCPVCRVLIYSALNMQWPYTPFFFVHASPSTYRNSPSPASFAYSTLVHTSGSHSPTPPCISGTSSHTPSYLCALSQDPSQCRAITCQHTSLLIRSSVSWRQVYVLFFFVSLARSPIPGM